MKPALQVGIGLRAPHHAALCAQAPPLAFVEVHSENFFGDGGAPLQMLQEARDLWPVSLHGVGLGLGSACGLDTWHLDRLAALVQRVQPVRVSDHACFTRGPRGPSQQLVHAQDLLPLAFTPAALQILAANVQQVQERLRRPILVENISAYLHWADDSLAETEFFNRLTRQTGCGLLLDLNNLVVNALNDGRGSGPAPGAAGGEGLPRREQLERAVRSACDWVDALDAGSVGEIHLAGYHDGGDIVIDDHGSPVHAPVWQVFRHALQRLGPRPTLVEWDTQLPEPAVLLGEAATAQALIDETLELRSLGWPDNAPGPGHRER